MKLTWRINSENKVEIIQDNKVLKTIDNVINDSNIEFMKVVCALQNLTGMEWNKSELEDLKGAIKIISVTKRLRGK